MPRRIQKMQNLQTFNTPCRRCCYALLSKLRFSKRVYIYHTLYYKSICRRIYRTFYVNPREGSFRKNYYPRFLFFGGPCPEWNLQKNFFAPFVLYSCDIYMIQLKWLICYHPVSIAKFQAYIIRL